MEQEQVWKRTIEKLDNELTVRAMQLSEIRRSTLRLPKKVDFSLKIERFHSLEKYVNDFQNQAAEVRRVRSLLPEQTWQNFIDSETIGLREQLMLEKACQKLKQLWKHRPELLKNGKEKQSRKQSNESSSQQTKRKARRSRKRSNASEGD